MALLNQLESFDYVKSHPVAKNYVKQQFALTLHRLGNYAGSIDVYKELLQSLSENKNVLRAKLHRLMGNVYEDQKNYKLAQIELHTSLKLMNEANSKPGKFLALKDLSSVLVSLGKYDSALLVAQEADKFFAKKGNIFLATACKRHIAQAYAGLGKDSLQKDYLYEALAGAKQIRYKWLLFAVHVDLANYHLGKNEFTETNSNLEQAHQLIHRVQPSERQRYYMLNYKANLKQDRLRLAFENLQIAQQIEDSIYAIQTDASLSYLGNKFDNNQMKKELALLQSTHKIEEIELKKSKFGNKVLLASLVFLISLIFALVALFFIIRNNRKNKKIYIESLQKTNETNQTLLAQKEQLLKEIHHRVKNNLQIISSILNLHRAEKGDKKRIMESCKSQIQTLAIIHEEIYKSEDLESINIKNYIDELYSYLARVRNQLGNLKLSNKVESFDLDLDTIIPTGLVINEILTLILDSSSSEAQEVEISGSELNGEYRFSITSLIPPQTENRRTSNLGISIVERLVQKQLRGTIQFNKVGDHVIGADITFTKKT